MWLIHVYFYLEQDCSIRLSGKISNLDVRMAKSPQERSRVIVCCALVVQSVSILEGNSYLVGTHVLVHEMKRFLNLRFFCYKIVKIIKLNNLHQKLRAFRSQTTVYRLAEGKKLRSVTPIKNSLVCPKLIRISKLNVTSV